MIAMKFCKYYPLSIVIIAGFIPSSCSQNISHSQMYTEQQMRDLADNIDESLIVDCAPPPKVRSHGGSVYLKKSRPLRTSVLSCRNRGGEFTVHANRQTRLEIWQAKANEGDIEAQTYVGEIYEKGLDIPPDYEFAAIWYKKAAAQGSKRAQNNLAFLHEKGLGVPKDPLQAFTWYKKAAGSPELNSEIGLSPDEIKELISLRKEINQKSIEAEQLRLQLEKAQTQLGNIDDTASALEQNKIQRERLQALNQQHKDRLALLTEKTRALEIELEHSSQTQDQQSELIDRISRKTQETEKLRAMLNESQNQLAKSQTDMAEMEKSHSTKHLDKNKQIAQLNQTITELTFKLQKTDDTLEDDKKKFSSQVWKSVNFGKYHALIIGNNQYKHLTKLRTPVNDAERLEIILKEKYAFKTRLLLNATRTDILDALGDYRETLRAEDSLLIFYAGHGTLTEARGYWQGVNSTDNRISDWISNVDITDQLEQMRARHILVVVDSCYSGAISRGSIEDLNPDMNEADKLAWIKQKLSLISRIAITSGGLYPVPDGAGKHSVFAQAFIRHLETNESVLAARSIFNTIGPRVTTRSKVLGVIQTPEYARLVAAADENGEFYFKPTSLSAQTEYFRFANLLWDTKYSGQSL